MPRFTTQRTVQCLWKINGYFCKLNHVIIIGQTNHMSPPLLFCSFLLGTKADRLLRLQQAAELYLTQVVEVRTFVGIVTFGSKGEIRAQLQQMSSDDDRRRLVSYLPTNVSTEEEANTCAGVKRGFEVAYPGSQLPWRPSFSFWISGLGGRVFVCLLHVFSFCFWKGVLRYSMVTAASAVRE